MAWKLRKDKLKTDEPEAQEPDAPLAVAAQTTIESTNSSFEPLGAPLGYDLSVNHNPATETTESSEETPFEEEAMPHFADEAMPRFEDESPVFSSPTESYAAPVEDEPISTLDIAHEHEPFEIGEPEEKEPITLGAFTPYQPPTTPIEPVESEPAPVFDPVAALSSPLFEKDAVEQAPVALAPDVENKELTSQELEVSEPVTPVEEHAAPAEEPLTFAEEPLTFADEDIQAAPPFEISPEREAAAPGLVTTDSDTGMPRVAPFILDAPDTVEPEDIDRMHHVVLRLGNLSASYFLVKDVTTIGRPDSAVQNYPDIEVELDDGVSRRHAEIRRLNDQFFVVDMGSTNGTVLNGEMLTPDQPVPLHTGDRIRIGERTEMLFE